MSRRTETSTSRKTGKTRNHRRVQAGCGTGVRSSACERVGDHASSAQIVSSGAVSTITITIAIEYRTSRRRGFPLSEVGLAAAVLDQRAVEVAVSPRRRWPR